MGGMNAGMNLLEERIKKDGICLPNGVVRVDSFLNHQIDPELMDWMGMEFARRFENEKVTKILTVEASGIAVAIMAALHLKVPVLFAKKAHSKNMGEDQLYSAKVHSFTKDVDCDLQVAKKYLSPCDKVLIIDDFLAMGEAVNGLMSIISQAEASVVGVGIAIEKGFQPGGARLRAMGVRVESIAILQLDQNGDIAF